MKTKSRILSIFMAVMMVLSLFAFMPQLETTASAATTKTVDQAVAWMESKVGSALDYDGAYGAQCVDLIYYYYQYLGASPVGGNAADYAWNTLPSGWTRIADATPQAGDIMVWTGNTYGHVALCGGTSAYYHQNFNSAQYVTKQTKSYITGLTGLTYYGVIRPDFESTKDISSCTVSFLLVKTYSGYAIEPDVTVQDGTEELEIGTDYTVSYSNNVNVGTATVTVTGKGDYTGTVKKTFTIKAKSISDLLISSISDQTYTGSAIEPEIVIDSGAGTLVSGTDYTVSYSNNTNVGTATATITGKGNYTGTTSVTFDIVQPYGNGDEAITFETGMVEGIDMLVDDGADESVLSVVEFNGSKALRVDVQDETVIPKVDINISSFIEDEYLSEISKITVDLTIASKDGVTPPGWAGGALATQGGGYPEYAHDEWELGEYENSVSQTITVTRTLTEFFNDGDEYARVLFMRWGTEVPYYMYLDNITFYDANGVTIPVNVTTKNLTNIADCTISSIAAQTYTGSAIKPTVTVKNGSTTLVSGTDYTVSYSNNTNVGTATVTITGKGNYTGTKTATFKIEASTIPMFIVGNATASAGQTVSVDISLANNPGITALSLDVEYDTTRLLLNSVTFNSQIGGMTSTSQSLESPAVVTWVNGLADMTDNTKICTLEFKVLDNAPDGKAAISLSYDSENVFNIASQSVDFGISDGYINVSDKVPGDVNSDGSINMRDVVALFQYVSRWNVSISTVNGDVTADGSLNMRDVVLLFQYVSRWDVTLL